MNTQLKMNLIHQSIVGDIIAIIHSSRDKAILAVDSERVILYWLIGKRIFEEEQQGKDRADYGTYLIKTLSQQLQPEFGSGFSIRQLERYRQFYRMFSNTSALRTQFSWTHYKTQRHQCKCTTCTSWVGYGVTELSAELKALSTK